MSNSVLANSSFDFYFQGQEIISVDGEVYLDLGAEKISLIPFSLPQEDIVQIRLVRKKGGSLFIDAPKANYDSDNLQKYRIFALRGTHLEVEVYFENKSVQRYDILFCPQGVSFSSLD